MASVARPDSRHGRRDQGLGKVGLWAPNLLQALAQVGTDIAQFFDPGDSAAHLSGWRRGVLPGNRLG